MLSGGFLGRKREMMAEHRVRINLLYTLLYINWIVVMYLACIFPYSLYPAADVEMPVILPNQREQKMLKVTLRSPNKQPWTVAQVSVRLKMKSNTATSTRSKTSTQSRLHGIPSRPILVSVPF